MKYFTVRNSALASAIAFITGCNYYTYNDGYSFEANDKTLKAKDEIYKLRKEIKFNGELPNKN